MKPINKSLFSTILILIILLTGISFLTFWGDEEGTLSENSFMQIFVKIFSVLRFPLHTIFWNLISKCGAMVYFTTLLINCIFYSILVERVITVFKK
jgi:hypothetical protein